MPINAMETSENVENVEKYISASKLNINNFIRKKDYRKAFGLLILFVIFFFQCI
jgi:hypothetical protein